MTDPNQHKIGFENLPNVYFKNVKTRIPSTPIYNNQIVITGFLTIFEGVDAKYWDDDEYLGSGHLRIRIRAFRKEDRATVIPSIGGLLEKVGEDIFIEGPFVGNKPIPFRVDIPKDKTYGLYISANLEIDLESIAATVGASFDWTQNNWYRGPTTEEMIFNRGDKVLSMYRYVQGDNFHFGPVHTHMAAGMFPVTMKGSFHEDPTPGATRGSHEVLKREPRIYSNQKNYYIEDNFDAIEEPQNIVAPAWVNAAFLTNFDSDEESVYFHLFISDSNLAIKTGVGRKLYEINPEYFLEINDKTEIKEIKINRTELKVFPNGAQANAGTSTQSGIADVITEQILFSEWPGDLVQKNYEYQAGVIYEDPTSAPVKSQIRKWPFSINNDVSLYSILDYDISEFIQEFFQYGVEVGYISLIDEMLKDKIFEMQDCLSEIQSSFQMFYNNSQFYDHEYHTMTPEGFKEINKEYGFGVIESDQGLIYNEGDDDVERQRKAYWTRAPQLYADLIRFIERSNDTRQDYLTLFNLLNPIAASPETMGTAILRILNIIQIIREEYDLTSYGNTFSNNSLPSSNSNIYRYTYSSYEITEHPIYKDILYYDYLPPPAGGPDNPFVPEMSREIYTGALLERVDTHLGEFMNDLNIIDPSQYPNYSNQQISQLLSPNGSFSFLTPTQATIQGKKVNLTSIDEEAIDQIQAVKAFSQGSIGLNVSTPKPNIQIRKTTTLDSNDVREYVGDTSLFATGIDNLLVFIQKEEPEISKTVLNLFSNKGVNPNLTSIRAANISPIMLPAPIKAILLKDFGNIDPFENLQTRDAFFNKYFNVIQISYLSSFPKVYGLNNISDPKYKPITREKLEATKGYLICKAEPINILSSLNSSYEEIQKKNIKNRVFIVKDGDAP
ncbi:MAG: hypothetical protein GOVbin1807_131 [Prokaryotic dsDNA virus sp.]|nr:MAG: hypothetical protein GOVbin1807_131 [Prokaryotic dsDNA virus sp.]|tara:strand:- start:1120 stop:3804 length:2685 start_codon:yes stop_codon:yes gene_type:complete